MKTKNIFILAMSLTLIILIPTPLLAQQGTLKVGLLAPMKGSANPDWGRKQVIGLKIALEKINKRGGIGGIPIETVIMGTTRDPQQGLAAYRKMATDDKVLVIIGPLFTSTYLDLFPVTNEEKVAIIATGSSKQGLSDLSKWPYAFRMTVTSEKKEIPLAKRWVEANMIKNMVVMYDRESIFASTIAEELWPETMKKLNVQILNNPHVLRTQQSMKHLQI